MAFSVVLKFIIDFSLERNFVIWNFKTESNLSVNLFGDFNFV